MNLGEYLKALCSCFYLKKNGYASARNWWKIQQHGNSCQSPEQSATLSGITWSNVRPHLCLYFPFHPSVCSHPWTVPLSLPFPFSRKQVLLGWVRASYRGGASRGADKGSSVQGGGDNSTAQGALTHRARGGDCSWRVSSHVSPTAFDRHISISEVTHQPLSPSCSKYL